MPFPATPPVSPPGSPCCRHTAQSPGVPKRTQASSCRLLHLTFISALFRHFIAHFLGRLPQALPPRASPTSRQSPQRALSGPFSAPPPVTSVLRLPAPPAPPRRRPPQRQPLGAGLARTPPPRRPPRSPTWRWCGAAAASGRCSVSECGPGRAARGSLRRRWRRSRPVSLLHLLLLPAVSGCRRGGRRLGLAEASRSTGCREEAGRGLCALGGVREPQLLLWKKKVPPKQTNSNPTTSNSALATGVDSIKLSWAFGI